jgi:hypothetical protein
MASKVKVWTVSVEDFLSSFFVAIEPLTTAFDYAARLSLGGCSAGAAPNS